MPICGGHHWVGLRWNLMENEMYYYDSLFVKDYGYHESVIVAKEYLKKLGWNKKGVFHEKIGTKRLWCFHA